MIFSFCPQYKQCFAFEMGISKLTVPYLFNMIPMLSSISATAPFDKLLFTTATSILYRLFCLIFLTLTHGFLEINSFLWSGMWQPTNTY